MDFSCMGVGSEMFIRAIAALVPACSAIPGKTESLAAASLAGARSAAGNFVTRASTAGGRPARRALKHGEQ